MKYRYSQPLVLSIQVSKMYYHHDRFNKMTNQVRLFKQIPPQ